MKGLVAGVVVDAAARVEVRVVLMTPAPTELGGVDSAEVRREWSLKRRRGR